MYQTLWEYSTTLPLSWVNPKPRVTFSNMLTFLRRIVVAPRSTPYSQLTSYLAAVSCVCNLWRGITPTYHGQVPSHKNSAVSFLSNNVRDFGFRLNYDITKVRVPTIMRTSYKMTVSSAVTNKDIFDTFKQFGTELRQPWKPPKARRQNSKNVNRTDRALYILSLLTNTKKQ